MNENSSETTLQFAGFIGLDWGDAKHAFDLYDQQGDSQKGIVLHSAESLHRWLKDLGQRFGGRPVALAVETNRGPLIHAFAQYPWLVIYPVHPATAARYRKAFTPSGAKADLPDATVLLELVRFHRHKLRPLELDDPLTRQLEALVQARRDAVDRRTQVLCQLIGLLKSYYPQALELAGKDLNTPLALEFLSRWPDLISLKAARPATLKSFYYRHNVRRPALIEHRLKVLSQAVPLSTDEAVVSVSVLRLRLLIDQLRTFQKHLAGFEAQIRQVFVAHPDALIFKNLPGAGPVLAPRLLVGFGSDRTRYPEAASLQKYGGLAPVREQSGKQTWTHWRWHAPTFLRQTFVEWAGQTILWSSWARTYYHRMKAKGKRHQAILRALAFKWIRVLWKCWRDRVVYDETHYLRQLRKRQSPNAPALAIS